MSWPEKPGQRTIAFNIKDKRALWPGFCGLYVTVNELTKTVEIEMSFEDDLAAINEDYFFREFTFSKTTFRPDPNQEVELADSIIWIDEFLIVFQVKERK